MDTPLPAPTPYPTTYGNSFPVLLPSERNKVRKRVPRAQYRRVNKQADEESYQRRFGKRYGAGTAPDNEGYPECDNVSNSVVTCYPDADTSLTSGDYSKLIWNPNLPQFTETGSLDIYLFSADTEQVVQSWQDVPNQRGSQPINPGDDWWSPIDSGWGPYDAQDPSQWSGTTRDWTYYAVLVPAGQSLSGGEEHQATFTAVQTAPLQNLVASSSASSISTASSRSSLSNASTASTAHATESIISSVSSASMASMASLSSISASNSELYSSITQSSLSTQSVLSTAASNSLFTTTNSNGDSVTSSVRVTPTGVLQNNGDDDNFPAWAIAVIVVLGVLALLGIAGGMYMLARHWRNTHGAAAAAEAGGAAGGANTPTQSEPLMKEHQGDGAGAAGAAGLGGAAAGAGLGAAGGAAATARSSEGSSEENGDREGPITSNEAAAMADAFRQALRSPEFDSGSGSGAAGSSGATGASQGVSGVQQSSAARQPELVNGSEGSH